MQILRGEIWHAPEGVQSEEYYNSIGYKLKRKAKVKYTAWNGKEYVKLYDALDILPIDSNKEKEIKEKKAKAVKIITCSECGDRTTDKHAPINGKDYCNKCVETYKKEKNMFLEKFLKQESIFFNIKNVHTNKKVEQALSKNPNEVLRKWQKNNAIAFKLGKKNKQNEFPVEILINGVLIGNFPERILLKRNKSLPNIYLTSKKLYELIEKGYFKGKAKFDGYKKKKNFQEREKHLIKIKMYY